MSQEFVRNMAIENRKRLVAGMMDHFEKFIAPLIRDEKVRETARLAYRQRLMAGVGQYHDFVLDCLKASVATGDGGVVNEEALRLLQQVHAGVTELRRVNS